MTELLTAAQMRALEQAAIDSGEVTGLELMERAGAGVVEAIFEEWPELEGRGASPSRSPEYFDQKEGALRAVVLCGPGNNGGDGFVVARLLSERGWEVEVFLYGEVEKLPPDARVNYERWVEIGEVCSLDATEVFNSGAELFLDALFGTGLTRNIPLDVYWALNAIWDLRSLEGVKLVAVDCPSYVCSDSGARLGFDNDRPSDLTVTFHSMKPGHVLGHIVGSPDQACGKVVVKDIGLPKRKYSSPSDIDLAEESQDTAWYLDKYEDHKYLHGHALILSGPSGRGGAARLAARGALRVGAGLVTVGCPTDALEENAAQLNAIMLREVEGADGLAAALGDERLSTLCLGPGLGLSKATEEMVKVALESGRKCVLDADALSIFENNDEALFAALHEDVVLTPHGWEFKRLFPDIAAKLAAEPTKGPAYSKVDATREAAARAGCTVLFKGADTVIADPDGRCSINSAHYDRAAPWLATAGSGDVLAGFIAGLLARGFAPKAAAETAAWLHVECALSFGAGLIAEDLPEELPKVFRKLGL